MIDVYRPRALVIIVATAILGLAVWLVVDRLLDQRKKQRYDANLGKIISLIERPAEAEPAAVFDMVRRFIHGHSRHAVDAEFRRVHGDRNLIATGIIAHATGQSSEPVHLECSTRSNLMSAVLRKLGYQTRIVYVFDTDGDDGEKLRSHTFVDVLNPSTGKWESHDPDYDFFWRAVAAGDRVSVPETAEELSKIEPCDENRCGWDLVSDEGQAAATIHSLIDIVSTVDKSADRRITRFTSRANPNKVFTFYDRRGTFCEIMAKLCTNIVGAATPGGSRSSPMQ